MSERWLPVVGYEGLYEVSDLGRVRTTMRQGSAGGLLKLTIGTDGYTRVHLRARDGGTTRQVHRLECRAFYGACPDGQEVRHLDGDKLNNRLGNLAYGTRRDQRLDDVRNGANPLARRPRCGSGHEYTPENTRVNARGHRFCRTCQRHYNRQYRMRKKAA